MKNQPRLLLACALALAACAPITDTVSDPSAGWNGGFEVVRDGLPVNWLVATPSKVDGADFRIALDEADRREGARALRFDVARYDPEPARLAPGVSQELPAAPGEHVLSFWVKNDGCDWSVRFGGVAAKTADYGRIDGADVPAGQWTRVERSFTLAPEHDGLRFELRVTSPGTLWIDDVRFDGGA